jgi:hypothetical protein
MQSGNQPVIKLQNNGCLEVQFTLHLSDFHIYAWFMEYKLSTDYTWFILSIGTTIAYDTSLGLASRDLSFSKNNSSENYFQFTEKTNIMSRLSVHDNETFSFLPKLQQSMIKW